MRCASFFAGVGGIDKGFELANVNGEGFETVYANEIDVNASVTYRLNFPNVDFELGDIRNVDPRNIPDFDVLLAGFPCQPFSIAGYQKGFEDEKGRGNLFFELLRIIKVKRPRVVFLENVKNLVSHDNGNTFRVIKESLESNGYHVKAMVLNSAMYGNVPQSRERIYIVCFRSVRAYRNFDFPDTIELTKQLNEVIDFDNQQDLAYYYTEEKCGFYDKLLEGVTRSDTVYQWRRIYVRENKSNLCPTLTANMGEGGHNVPLIRMNNGQIRKLTPRECFNLQGYPSDYLLPNNICKSALYKQAGNSVVVTVISRIAERILMAIE